MVRSLSASVKGALTTRIIARPRLSMGLFLEGASACLARLALSETIGLRIHSKDVNVVGQAVGQGASETFFSEGGSPFIERQV